MAANLSFNASLNTVRESYESMKEKVQPYARVLAARAKNRPTSQSFIANLTDDFLEFHGDRRFGDDGAIIAGIARINDLPVTVIGIEKGITLQESIKRNFGAAHPEGYRKALRLMKQAEKFNRPVLCIVDTSGAYCGIGAEERGQGQAIAENLMEMMTLKTPVISLLIGEGGSGGALALAVADQVWMMENSVYSVISPEGCASILWKDSQKMQEAAEHLKLTAQDLFEMGVVERVIPESSAKEFDKVYALLKTMLYDSFQSAMQKPTDELVAKRYQRFRQMGIN
ncbi:MAG: acetyl-CoA carboxylase carboxyltransferase subunit alpha [Peptococcaceae bacterium]|nr:acetyl-CoA carboxylase carboxyltransferase subunit alpha [Peptococcaceae bacterium]